MDVVLELMCIVTLVMTIVIIGFFILIMNHFRKDNLRRVQDSQTTRKVLSETSTELPGLAKRVRGGGKGQPAMINPYDSLIGRYKGRLTHVRITFNDKGQPRNLKIDMVHTAKVPENLNIKQIQAGFSGGEYAVTASEFVKRYEQGLMTLKDDIGDIDDMLLDDVSLTLQVRMIKKNENLTKILEVMSEMCEIAEFRYDRLTLEDIPSNREFPLEGNGILKFEPDRLVIVDGLNRTTTYQYGDIHFLTNEKVDIAGGFDFKVCLTFKDDVKAIFGIMDNRAWNRVGVRALVLDKMGLLYKKKGTMPVADIINELSR
jgi:hypothetical protein